MLCAVVGGTQLKKDILEGGTLVEKVWEPLHSNTILLGDKSDKEEADERN